MAAELTPAEAFRARATAMKSWRPANPPSNRDKLEIYALNKQAVSGDAPPKDPPGATPADRAKLAAWRTKRGTTQSEAMRSYVSECERQVRVYGTAGGSAAGGGGGGDASPSTATTPGTGPGGTPTNTPSAPPSPDDGALLTPRGIAAVPLLCAAAAESRSAYLSRLRATGAPANGWWAKQEPLCADPGTVLAIPEGAVIAAASAVEWASLSLGSDWAGKIPLGVPPSAVQAGLWPVHNVLLAVWIALVFVSTLIASAVSMARTVLLGARRTGAPLPRVFSEEVAPASRAASGLCEPHQAVTVRLAGLALMPLPVLCDASGAAGDAGGSLAGAAAFVGAAALTWWYWCCVLPWLAFVGLWAAVSVGWCFALIELAGV